MKIEWRLITHREDLWAIMEPLENFFFSSTSLWEIVCLFFLVNSHTQGIWEKGSEWGLNSYPHTCIPTLNHLNYTLGVVSIFSTMFDCGMSLNARSNDFGDLLGHPPLVWPVAISINHTASFEAHRVSHTKTFSKIILGFLCYWAYFVPLY